jgi:2-dehydropantoate 2-reductase
MGGLFGGYLARAGEDVFLIDVSRSAVDAINQSGLAIEEKDGSVATIKATASTTPDSVGPVDLILNFVKCYDTEAAIRSALPMMGRDTAVVSLQNGWGNADRIAAVAGNDRVIVGLTYHSATLLAPGRVKHAATGVTHMGELDGRSTSRLETAVRAFRNVGFDVNAADRLLDEVWKKLAVNVCALPTAALLRMFANELNQHDGTRAMMQGLLREMVQVATAQRIILDESETLVGDYDAPRPCSRRQGLHVAGRRSQSADGDRRHQRRDRGGRQTRQDSDATERCNGLARHRGTGEIPRRSERPIELMSNSTEIVAVGASSGDTPRLTVRDCAKAFPWVQALSGREHWRDGSQQLSRHGMVSERLQTEAVEQFIRDLKIARPRGEQGQRRKGACRA